MKTATEKRPSSLMTVREVCEELGIADRTFRAMVSRGEFPRPVRFPKGTRFVRIRRRDFDAYLESLRPKR